jgi:hypothetical protein
MKETQSLYGLLAEFSDPELLVAAAQRVTAAGYKKTDAFSPFPVHGLAEALAFHKTRIPLLVLIAGLVGGISGFMMCYLGNGVFFPLNVGGRPYFSWPAFIPITFELTVLCAGFTAAISMIALNGLPTPYHPLFNVDRFDKASRDGFFLCIESTDPLFDLEKTAVFLTSIGASTVDQVPA